MNKQIGRNSSCPCGSGLKFKFCCITKQLRERKVNIGQNCDDCNGELYIDFTNNIFNALSSQTLPLKFFCRDNNFYFFEIVTIGQVEILNAKLRENSLKKQDIIELYKVTLTREIATRLLHDSTSELEFLKKRSLILNDAFEAHFEGKYTLSITALFPQLEGILREVGNLRNNETFQSNIPTEIWEDRLLFPIKDNAQNFNSFVNKLFEGSKNPADFNRNVILHGFNINYYSEEHSILLILSILEIRLFYWWINKTEDFKDNPSILKSFRK